MRNTTSIATPTPAAWRKLPSLVEPQPDLTYPWKTVRSMIHARQHQLHSLSQQALINFQAARSCGGTPARACRECALQQKVRQRQPNTTLVKAARRSSELNSDPPADKPTATPAQAEADEPEHDSPGVRAALALLGFYRNILSPIMPNTCRYLPTCSQYSIAAYKRFGVPKGTALTAWRLMRCNPWGGRGYDPPQWPPPGLEKLFPSA